jgi:hypothetical protein
MGGEGGIEKEAGKSREWHNHMISQSNRRTNNAKAKQLSQPKSVPRLGQAEALHQILARGLGRDGQLHWINLGWTIN